MNRTAFLAGSFAAGLIIESPRGRRLEGRGDEQYDPAIASTGPALRVLLGTGAASAIDAQSFLYDGRRYRGTFALRGDGTVLSTVPLEGYLYSVVAREMSPSWPAAALAAQAIAARTYVLQRSNPRRDYDVVTSEADQVYGGIEAEAPAASAAVDATAGVVLRYGDAFAQLFYSSSCGGHTESSADAWTGGANLPYLQGVICPWCTKSPDYTWTREVSGDALAHAFPGPTVGTPMGLSVASSDPSGRARDLVLTGDAGSASTRGTAFRAALGSRVIRSLLIRGITPGTGPGSFVIEGGGLGHGVGLCQWGARGMAAAGKSADDILNFYFPGTQRSND
ncbi:MAG: SpoIID/LytB domain-containing protein [Candidatus Eremiobacteraeota bacterium]|nr:SpoIID/LytB domain-containing protein [Candidatus Eremiobacteraeota bacterium]